MCNLVMRMVIDNAYILPKTARVIHNLNNSDVDLLEEVASQNKQIFIVSPNLFSSNLNKDRSHEIGTVVNIERIERHNNNSKLFVKGLYRARKVPDLNLLEHDYIRVKKLSDKGVSLRGMKLAYIGLIRKFKDYAKQEDSLRVYQTIEKFNNFDIEKTSELEVMAYLINKLTQTAMYEFSFYPVDNQSILEEDDIILRALKVESIIEHLMIESYNKTYSFPEYIYERPTIDENIRIEEMRTVAKIENIGIPKISNEKKINTKINERTKPKKSKPPSELKEIVAKLDEIKFPKENRIMIQRELDKAIHLNKSGNEYREIITYLNLVTILPWSYEKKERSIIEAEQVLNESHYGMDVVKKEIIKSLAERKLNNKTTGAVLCLAGPPGVGKTSFVRSIAESMNKEFIKIKLGGVEREPMIRGFERTYRSAIPGIFIKEMTNISSVNPVILLDEIDKIGGNQGEGDVASALLEVLDPSQNNEFRDHYLTMPYDLSKVLFIATANDLEKIPNTLKDRMEIIYLDGYSVEEKFNISKHYIVKQSLNKGWLKNYNITIDDEVLRALVDQFSHEPGIRSLERSIAGLYREIALKIEIEQQSDFHITTANMNRYFKIDEIVVEHQKTIQENQIGRANLLKVRNRGSKKIGSIGMIEVSRFPGNGKLTSTGNLGEVTLESIEVAFSYIRLKAEEINIEHDFKEKNDFHLHFPEAAVPKEGPSAGISIVISIISALTDQPIKCDVAMTGEISIYGNVRSVGGVREKVIGAYQAGMSKVIIPQENEHEIEEIPVKIRENLEIVTVKKVNEVIEHIFESTLRASILV